MYTTKEKLDDELFWRVVAFYRGRLYPEDLQDLIDAGANVDYRDDLLATTPLHEAEFVEVAQVLLDNGARLDIANGDGQTPYEVHERKGRHHICDLILAEQAKRAM